LSQHVISNLRHNSLKFGEDYGGETRLKMRQHAVAIYGQDAVTAVAYCALAAWCECQQAEYKFWSDLFNEMQTDTYLH